LVVFVVSFDRDAPEMRTMPKDGLREIRKLEVKTRQEQRRHKKTRQDKRIQDKRIQDERKKSKTRHDKRSLHKTRQEYKTHQPCVECLLCASLAPRRRTRLKDRVIQKGKDKIRKRTHTTQKEDKKRRQ
jgi:succinate dehydrogenase/fumarate reductase-like Fe-S protein